MLLVIFSKSNNERIVRTRLLLGSRIRKVLGIKDSNAELSVRPDPNDVEVVTEMVDLRKDEGRGCLEVEDGALVNKVDHC